ncbi:MAG: nucleotidyltransferase family protein [Candidatus Eisenbacteria bacterium]|nr:nucleotidyltransferase family protein [Candidatus Eisenbacteria bacterium]
MTTLESIRQRRTEIIEVARKHGATNLRIFGSVLRGDDTPESDVDFLVDVPGPTSPWFPAGLILDLEDLLRRRVDLVTERGLNPFVRDGVVGEAQPL